MPAPAAARRAVLPLAVPLLGVAFGSALAAAPLAAQARPATPVRQASRGSASAADALAERGRAYEAAWAAGDARAIGAMYAPDAVAYRGDGSIARGRDAIVQDLARGFSGPNQGTTAAIESGDPQLIAPDVAVGHGTYTVKRADGTTVTTGGYLNVWTRTGGVWMIRSLQTYTPTKPAGAAR